MHNIIDDSPLHPLLSLLKQCNKCKFQELSKTWIVIPREWVHYLFIIRSIKVRYLYYTWWLLPHTHTRTHMVLCTIVSAHRYITPIPHSSIIQSRPIHHTHSRVDAMGWHRALGRTETTESSSLSSLLLLHSLVNYSPAREEDASAADCIFTRMRSRNNAFGVCNFCFSLSFCLYSKAAMDIIKTRIPFSITFIIHRWIYRFTCIKSRCAPSFAVCYEICQRQRML